MSSLSFEEMLISDIKKRIIAEIGTTNFVKSGYPVRTPIPNEFIAKAWEQVDWDEVLKKVTVNLETQICNSIVGNMSTEVRTDIKKLMAIAGMREKFRIKVYPHLMKVLEDK